MKRHLALTTLFLACGALDPTSDQTVLVNRASSEPGPEGITTEQEQLAAGKGFVSEPADEAAFLYDQSELRTFELRLSEENLAILDSDPIAEQYVPGMLVYEGTEYGPVGIRYKGSFGSWVGCTANSTPTNPLNVGGAKSCPKLSLKVSFNWSDPEGRFFGLKKLQFHAMNLDPSMMRERLGYALFRQMDVPAPRAVHARVLINGQLSGIYVNVEYIDGRFTRSHYEDGKGNLYKEVWPTHSANQVPTTEELLRSGLRTNEEEGASVQKMLEFGQAVNSTQGAARAELIEKWMDVDNTMRMIAVDRTIRADDGLFHFYCDEGCSNHNYYIYERKLSDRLSVIPWDLDNAFVVVREEGLTPDAFVSVVDRWNDRDVTCTPKTGVLAFTPTQLPPSCDPLVNGWGEFAAEYQSAVNDLLDGPFAVDAVDELLTRWEKQISGAIGKAHDANAAQVSLSDWQAGIVDLRERVVILRDAATERVENSTVAQ